MNFEFSDEQKQMGEQARRFLADKCPTSAVRAVLEGPQAYDAALWKGLAEMGFLGVTIPEEYGGLGLGYLELCVIAEEMGRAIAPVPFSSSVFLATEFLLQAGSEAQKQAWLPKLAAGEAIGTFAHAERAGAVGPKTIQLAAADGRLTGAKTAVPDGTIADFAIVSARTGTGNDPRAISLFLVDLSGAGVTREELQTIDPTRGHAALTFAGAAAEPLGATGEGWAILERVFDRAAILTAFEQIGGADRALEMGRDYALDRMAFGRPIGSFQAIKHMLADMYVSATEAFHLASKENIQVHGGIGFTWAVDCHLFYRRSKQLGVAIGSLPFWQERLADLLETRNAA